MGMGAAETSVVAVPLTQIQAIVHGVKSSCDDPEHLTAFLCHVVKMALKALAEAKESGAAEEMDEDTVAELTSWVGGGEEGDGEEGEGEEGEGGNALTRKRPRSASAHHKGASAAAPSGTSSEADKAAREARLATRAANRESVLATSAAGRGGGGGEGGGGGGGGEASSSAAASSEEPSAQRDALIAAIEKLRRGGRLEGGESMDRLPQDLLPTRRGEQLSVVDVFQRLCARHQVPHQVLQLSVDCKLQREGEDSPLPVDGEPAAGDLVVVKAGAKVLADRFASGWGNFDASAVSLARSP